MGGGQLIRYRDRLRYEIVLSRESGFGGRTYISEERPTIVLQ
jgi:hypothetical protein